MLLLFMMYSFSSDDPVVSITNIRKNYISSTQEMQTRGLPYANTPAMQFPLLLLHRHRLRPSTLPTWISNLYLAPADNWSLSWGQRNFRTGQPVRRQHPDLQVSAEG